MSKQSVKNQTNEVSTSSPTNEIFASSEALFKNNDLISALQIRGLIPKAELTADKVKQLQKKKAKQEYRNAKLLLEQYRTIVTAVSTLPEHIAYELNTPFKDVDDLVERCDIASAYGDEIVESELRGIQRTRKLMDIIHKALTKLKTMSPDGELFYKIILLTYITPKVLKVDAIVKKLGISRSTYFRKRDEAVNLFSSILWLTPNRELDLWIDFVTLLNEEESK